MLRISASHFLTSLISFLRWFNFCTSLILAFPICNSYLRRSILLTTIYSVVLQIMVIPFFSLSFNTRRMSSYSFSPVSAINTVSSSYLKIMSTNNLVGYLVHFGWHHCIGLDRMTIFGENAYPCLTSLFIFVYLMNSFSIHILHCFWNSLEIIFSPPHRGKMWHKIFFLMWGCLWPIQKLSPVSLVSIFHIHFYIFSAMRGVLPQGCNLRNQVSPPF